ncbi:MAG: efflux RND transporter periplasmic adaptor subunit [Steroidobacteraceae bacterium]
MNDNDSIARPNLRKRLVIMLAIVGALFALLIGFNTFKGIMIGKAMKSMGNPPQTVATMVAAYQPWQPRLEAVGDVRAVHGVDLALDIAGLVDRVDVRSGARVREGQVLMKLVDAQDRATLAALQASAQLAKLTAERSQEQLAARAISPAQHDADMANLKTAQAQAASQAALVARKTLRAPFAGRIGIITVNPGLYLNAGDTVATLQKLDSVYVDFTAPQVAVGGLQVGVEVEVTTDAYPGTVFAGVISAIDPKVDVETRNLRVEATVANPDERLVPGMFVKVAVPTGGEQRYLTLPQTAISYAPFGDTVFVVREGTPPHVEQVVVTVGPTRGDQVAVLSGIAAGEVVVTSGQLKLKNGTPVKVNNAVQPTFDADPHPVEQ